jgi:hypothetical protein
LLNDSNARQFVDLSIDLNALHMAGTTVKPIDVKSGSALKSDLRNGTVHVTAELDADQSIAIELQ